MTYSVGVISDFLNDAKNKNDKIPVFLKDENEKIYEITDYSYWVSCGLPAPNNEAVFIHIKPIESEANNDNKYLELR